MAKKQTMTYTIKRREPFVVNIGDKTYKIPPMTEMGIDEWCEVYVMRGDMKANMEKVKAFFIGACPDLAKEDISDFDYLNIWNMYSTAMGES